MYALLADTEPITHSSVNNKKANDGRIGLDQNPIGYIRAYNYVNVTCALVGCTWVGGCGGMGACRAIMRRWRRLMCGTGAIQTQLHFDE